MWVDFQSIAGFKIVLNVLPLTVVVIVDLCDKKIATSAPLRITLINRKVHSESSKVISMCDIIYFKYSILDRGNLTH